MYVSSLKKCSYATGGTAFAGGILSAEQYSERLVGLLAGSENSTLTWARSQCSSSPTSLNTSPASK